MKLGVTGHQELPTAEEGWIAQQLRAVISQHPSLLGLSSLAVGADQLFAEQVLDAGHGLIAVLPCRNYADTFDSAEKHVYDALLDRACATVTLDFGPPSEAAFLAAGQYVVDNSDHLVAIWDGQAAQGKGGTADIVAYARSHDVPVTIIWPAGVSR